MIGDTFQSSWSQNVSKQKLKTIVRYLWNWSAGQIWCLIQKGFSVIQKRAFVSLSESYHDNIVVPPFSFYFKSENVDRAGRIILKFECLCNEKYIFYETKSTFQIFKGFLSVKYKAIKDISKWAFDVNELSNDFIIFAVKCHFYDQNNLSVNSFLTKEEAAKYAKKFLKYS